MDNSDGDMHSIRKLGGKFQIQINGIKLLGNASEASMKHLKAMERRALKLWGEATGKTIPLRMKKICMYNVSTSGRFINL